MKNTVAYCPKVLLSIDSVWVSVVALKNFLMQKNVSLLNNTRLCSGRWNKTFLSIFSHSFLSWTILQASKFTRKTSVHCVFIIKHLSDLGKISWSIPFKPSQPSLSTSTLSLKTLSMLDLIVTLNINEIQHNVTLHKHWVTLYWVFLCLMSWC